MWGRATLWSPGGGLSVRVRLRPPACALPALRGASDFSSLLRWAGQEGWRGRRCAFPPPRWVMRVNSPPPRYPRGKQRGTSPILAAEALVSSWRQPPKAGVLRSLTPPPSYYPSELSETPNPSNCPAAGLVPLPGAVPVSCGSFSVCGRR